jgi:hypothetical protein
VQDKVVQWGPAAASEVAVLGIERGHLW